MNMCSMHTHTHMYIKSMISKNARYLYKWIAIPLLSPGRQLSCLIISNMMEINQITDCTKRTNNTDVLVTYNCILRSTVGSAGAVSKAIFKLWFVWYLMT